MRYYGIRVCTTSRKHQSKPLAIVADSVRTARLVRPADMSGLKRMKRNRRGAA